MPLLLVPPPGVRTALPRGAVLEAPLVELRDVAPTFLDLAGVPLPPGVAMNGSSLACFVLRDPSGETCGAGGAPWRDWLDLEHDIV